LFCKRIIEFDLLQGLFLFNTRVGRQEWTTAEDSQAGLLGWLVGWLEDWRGGA